LPFRLDARGGLLPLLPAGTLSADLVEGNTLSARAARPGRRSRGEQRARCHRGDARLSKRIHPHRKIRDPKQDAELEARSLFATEKLVALRRARVPPLLSQLSPLRD